MAMVVFSGGARSGKSGAAQDLARQCELDGARVCVAVFGQPAPGDEEFAERVRRHRDERPQSWTTIEAADGSSWLDEVPADALLLVDCAGTWLGLVMEEESQGADAAPGAEAVEAAFGELVRRLIARGGDTIVVTNEVGDGIVPAYESGRLFRDVMGRTNRALVDAADAAYLCVAGRLVELTALPRRAAWPED